jgi:hypothetical protein
MLDLTDRYPEAAPVGNLVDIALGRGWNHSPGEIGARTVAFVDAMYRSARSGRQEAVSGNQRGGR